MAKQNGGNPTRVLCVDDDVYLTELLEYALSREGFMVRIAHTATQALEAAERERPDVVILDVNLPGADGFTLCAHFRTVVRLPVIMLSARHTEEEVIAGFGQGADDYVTKPFSMQVLVHRLHALVRRTRAAALPGANTATRANYRLGEALFNAAYNEISHHDACIKLTPTEGKILHLLLSHEGQVLPAERIMSRVQSFDTQSDVTVIKTHIRNLRIKIARALGDTPVIHTVPGSGYTLRQPTPRAEHRELA
ncbi:MAG TPA: response regulator transcription factor [Chloroflexota bacterium]|nr:response regulator transcription factor [Chloroflexota bacterium]